MHNKFTIVDGEWLATGSWNYTTGDTYRLNNWMGIFRSKELAARYQAEFEQLFAGKFAGAKAATPRTTALTIGGAKVETCFAPKGKCADLIVQTIEREASKSIRFLAFSFTHDDIGKAMTDKRRAGVSVSGVFETTGSQVASSEYGKMKAAGLDVYTDGNPYVMHHKVIVIDDRVTVAGSFNFSSNADKDNDENLLIVTDPGFAAAFAAEFERVLAVAKNPPAKASPAKK
jgi:phosphatidylserine/phosphatidylglycerophosphate/cardiolipin synthase-like enzyme